jgi:uncharacterized protein (UPF0218 family)
LSTEAIDRIALIRLKHPFGKLLIGPPEKTIEELKELIYHEKPRKIFAIGDVVASNMVRSGIQVNAIIIDFQTERRPAKHTVLDGFKIVKVKNTPRTVAVQACDVIKEVFQGSSPTAIIVDGEEDLLTLPAIESAPLESVIVYGQPHVGIVLVHINERTKNEARQLFQIIEKGLSKRLSIRP